MRGAHPRRHLEGLVAQTLALRSGETVMVAASGGADSTALAALAARAAVPAGASVVLAHVNHGVRASAWQDEGVVLAAGAALRLRVVCASIEPGPGDEGALRARRYEALAHLAACAGARSLFTAHHAGDQTESVLLALFRGTGHRGLAGMEQERSLTAKVRLIRPLLRTPPQALLEYCRAQHLPYALDATNRDLSRRRNAVRAALASLRAVFPRLDEAVARCAQIVREERAATEPAMLRSHLLAMLQQSGAGRQDVSFERLEAAARLVASGGQGRVFLKRGVEVTVRRG